MSTLGWSRECSVPRRWAVSSAFVASLFLLTPASLAAETVRLVPAQPVALDKSGGRVDQVVAGPGGGLIVRDADFWNEESQRIEEYDAGGRLERRIGSYGRSPGEYYRLKQIEVDERHRLWVVDVMGRLSRFDASGRLLETQLLQRPGFQPTSLALDESRDVFYLGGCLPTQTYLDLGCNLVHQYSLADGRYLRSFLPTDREALEKHLLSLEDYLVAVAPDGTVFAADAPLFKVFKIDPDSGDVETFPIAGPDLAPAPALVPGAGLESGRNAYRDAFLIERLMVVNRTVLVSIRAPAAQGGYRLFALDAETGAPLPLEGAPEATLVGRTPRGGLYFAQRRGDGYEVVEHRLVRSAAEEGSR